MMASLLSISPMSCMPPHIWRATAVLGTSACNRNGHVGGDSSSSFMCNHNANNVNPHNNKRNINTVATRFICTACSTLFDRRHCTCVAKLSINMPSNYIYNNSQKISCGNLAQLESEDKSAHTNFSMCLQTSNSDISFYNGYPLQAYTSDNNQSTVLKSSNTNFLTNTAVNISLLSCASPSKHSQSHHRYFSTCNNHLPPKNLSQVGSNFTQLYSSSQLLNNWSLLGSLHPEVRSVSTSTVLGSVGSRSAGLNVFDRHAKLMQRERAAAREDAKVYDYLKDEVGYRLSDRIYDIKREFKVGLDLGCGRGHLSKNITDATLGELFMGELSPRTLASAVAPKYPGLKVQKLPIDEEMPLPFQDKQLDVVLSNLSLHWVNNLPGCLREVHRCLQEDGVLLASMFGGDTLYQLRSALLLAEMEREGGISAHVSPFTEVQDIGGLLSQAGFETLTIDTEDITVGYPSMFELLWDLQGMAESNASATRKPIIARDTLMAAAAIYQEMYGQEEGVPATFQIIYMIGWKPNPNAVSKPAPRGSGEVSLKELGRLDELMKERGIAGKLQFMEEMAQPGGHKLGDKQATGGAKQDTLSNKQDTLSNKQDKLSNKQDKPSKKKDKLVDKGDRQDE